ncbi:unnamed protein product [Kuraishia capsulata CBS 1993]|uniref:Brl1/Brr6 domain-containing protein n=1 Tax=Kuraishia capsulata CBS 1993 TaxID=1382522 RepID=W6MHC3_9ASCO|nr:uncharacterized protein KUCA_T00001594001 [Kuraishia capsulata CBS 1993]CDK25624.1 unnamed protein product [Kuraishia capsulata CBS 1993]
MASVDSFSDDVLSEEGSFSQIELPKIHKTPKHELQERFDKAVKARGESFSPSPKKISRPLLDKTNIKAPDFAGFKKPERNSEQTSAADLQQKTKYENPVVAAHMLLSTDAQKMNTPVSSPLFTKVRNLHPDLLPKSLTDPKSEPKSEPKQVRPEESFKNKPDLSKSASQPKSKLPSLDEEMDALADEPTEATESFDEDSVRVHQHIYTQKMGWRRIISDPAIPYVLSLYLQLFFNIVLVSMIGYFIFSFVSTVRADVENKIEIYATEVLQETSLCSREYLRNNCSPGKRVPYLEKACMAWERCMNRDPASVGRAKIGAETFAEIINGFVKPISWKSIFTLLLLTVGSLVFTNAAFGSYRNFSSDNAHPPPHPQSQEQEHTQQYSPVRSPSRSSPVKSQPLLRNTPASMVPPTPHRAPVTPRGSNVRRSGMRFGSALRYQEAEKQINTSPILSSLAHRQNHRY